GAGFLAWLIKHSGRVFLFPLLLPASLLSQTPHHGALFARATPALQQSDPQQGGAGLARLVHKARRISGAHFHAWLALQEQGRYEDAITSFHKALALKRRLHGANLFLGISAFRINHFDEADAAIIKETANFPKDPNAWMWLGVVNLARDHPEEAVEALDKADKIKPGDPDILYHRGRAHLLVSKNSYAEMFRVDPESWRVHRVLAQANAEADRHLDAIAEYEAAIKL